MRRYGLVMAFVRWQIVNLVRGAASATLVIDGTRTANEERTTERTMVKEMGRRARKDIAHEG